MHRREDIRGEGCNLVVEHPFDGGTKERFVNQSKLLSYCESDSSTLLQPVFKLLSRGAAGYLRHCILRMLGVIYRPHRRR